MSRFQKILLMVTLISVVFCGSLPAEESLLSRYDLKRPVSKLKLPAELKEVSGITLSENGRLFAQNDEEGTVYELDHDTGKIRKRFSIREKRWFGDFPVDGDFEDIVLAGNRFFMVTSAGVLYGFSEGKDGQSVQSQRYETGLNDLYDVEGLCYDPETESLLLACKEYPKRLSLKQLLGSEKKKSKIREKPVYAFSLNTMTFDRSPRFLIDVSVFMKKGKRVKFKPSAITRHPGTGNFLVLSAVGRLLVEITSQGTLVDVVKLSSKDHPQPEGIALTADNEMLISNEGVSGKATLLRYSMRK
ncbi:MAG: hypothetical protein C1941_08870 [Prosthecochloris sp.]|nr:hypothetical protein [Prosthecochloris sp.]